MHALHRPHLPHIVVVATLAALLAIIFAVAATGSLNDLRSPSPFARGSGAPVAVRSPITGSPEHARLFTASPFSSPSLGPVALPWGQPTRGSAQTTR